MSQGSLNVPTTGPDPPSNFAGQINTALSAVISRNSGGSPPTNFPTTGGASTAFQDWADTTVAATPKIKEYDGTSFVHKYSIDTSAHIYMPKMGGGSTTLANAATVDIGSVPHFFITITDPGGGHSAVVDISSFGSNAALQIGETKMLRFSAVMRINYNATSMILPAADNLDVQIGDIIEMVYLGSGNWLCKGRSPGSKWNVPPGSYVDVHATGVVPGLVRANGRTIGNTASSGTERNDPDTQNLFVALYTKDPNLAVSGGRSGSGTTRAEAITDYNANKTITLPDARFRQRVCVATHGAASDASRSGGALFASPSSTIQNTLGAVGGEAGHINLNSEQSPHIHTIIDAGHFHSISIFSPNAQPGVSGGTGASFVSQNTDTKTTGVTLHWEPGVAVSFTAATPTVVSWTGHGLQTGHPVSFLADIAVGGAVMPTGVSANTTYYVVNDIGSNSFHIATSEANARAGTLVAASSTGNNIKGWAAANQLPPFILVGAYLAL